MKRYIVSIASCLVMACALVMFAPAVGARANTTGVISGAVVNATHQNAVVAGQKVTLQRSVGGAAQDIATTETGQDGAFTFTNITGDANDTFAVYTQYQGGMFPSQSVNLGSDAATSLQLKVYDTTNDDANLKVTAATLLVRQPRPVNGLIGVGEIITVENTGTTAFVGTPTGAAGKPMRLLRFATPPNASNLTLGVGFAGSQIATTDKGFGSTATVPPGTTEFAYAIDIPYAGTAADLSYKAVYPTARVVVLVPLDMFVNGKDFAAQGLVDSLGSRYQVFSVDNAAAGKLASLQLTGLPEAGEKNSLDARALTIFAAILALLALLALLFYLRRGNIATALRLIPAAHSAGDASLGTRMTAASSAEIGDRERLLHELLELERAHAAGSFSDVEFRQRDRDLRRRLRELMASAPAVSAPMSVAGDTAESAEVAPTTGAAEEQEASSAREEAASEQGSGGRR